MPRTGKITLGENLKYKLKCVSCSRQFSFDSKIFTCPKCGPFHGTLDVIYPLDELRKKLPSLKKINHFQSVFESFIDIFPYKKWESLPPLKIGQTPLVKSENVIELTGMKGLWFKDDGRNPSASFKDRASAVAIAMARESNAKAIAAASTGNAASSLATLAASVLMKAFVFVPKNAPRPKMIQILIHGAHVLKLDCDYDKAFDLCQEACQKFGWYNRNTAVNPYTGEGKKSAALEIVLEMGDAPDAVICPVGDGCIISGLFKGFEDLLGLGLINRLPRLYGIQAEGANPIVRAFKSGKEIVPLKSAATVADSISVGYPRDGIKALRAVKNSKGAMIAVSDEDILTAQKTLAAKGGIFAEPAASASFAGLLKLQTKGMVKKSEIVVVLLTGHGLKDIETAAKNISAKIETIAADMGAVEKAIAKMSDQ